MIEHRPDPDAESTLPEDAAPNSDPKPTPRVPPPPPANHVARPENLANKVKVTPLDDDENIKDGIEVNET